MAKYKKYSFLLALSVCTTTLAHANDRTLAKEALKSLKVFDRPSKVGATTLALGYKIMSPEEAGRIEKERLAFEIERSLIIKWRQSCEQKKMPQELLDKNFKAEGWKLSPHNLSTASYFEARKIEAHKEGKDLATWFKTYNKVEDCTLNMVGVDSIDKSDSKAKITLHFDVRGTGSSQELQNDRGDVTAEVMKTGKDWRLTSFTLLSGERVSTSKKFFDDATKMTQLHQAPIEPRGEAIRRGGYALALGDYNNDGRLDLYLGREGSSILYKGNAKGEFQKDESFKFPTELSVKTAAFADMDNDGWRDLITVKFVPLKESMVTLYRNDKGTFKKVNFDQGFNPPDFAMPAAVADFNNDGYLDFYVGYPGVKDFTHVAKPEASQKSPHGLFLNDQKGSLKGFDGNAFLDSKNRIHNRDLVFPHSALAADFDQDGFQDLIVVDDRGGLSPMFKNLGNGKFQEVTEQLELKNVGFGMGSAVADVDHDGLLDIVMTNVDFDASRRIGTSQFGRGLTLWRNKGNGKFEETKNAGLDWIGLGAGGAEFIDFDNDGWADLYVKNGLWSGTQRDEDLSSYFVRSWIAGFVYPGITLDSTQSGFMKILTDFKGNLTDTKTEGTLSMAGYQRNRLFRNNRNGTFTEIGYLAGVDSIADGYVVAKADLNKDGKMDLVLRNADPGTLAYKFPSVQVYVNKLDTKNHSLILGLEGTKSNKEGFGAKVMVSYGTEKVIQELSANNGAAQSDRYLHFGLGEQKEAARIEVRWPSGIVTVQKNVPAGFITIKEAATDEKVAAH